MQRQALSLAGSLGVVLALTVTAFAGTTQAAPEPGIDFRDARYCEILELKGTIPDARVVVWNTIGLNDCPAAKWEALDAASLAAELGDAAVILNGPRHFLMDSATGKRGRVRFFDGIRMRRVATIPIRSPADLAQVPYSERTINRDNTFTWEAGRRVYELLAPDGASYLMQSYALIRDPGQTIGDLRSLGERLELPEGWRYRTRRLKRDLTLTATGKATVIQDELANTYQRMPDGRDDATRRRVALDGTMETVGFPEPGTVEDRGTVTGRPFRYRGIRGRDLKAYDRNTLDGQSGALTLDGFASF